MRLRGSRAFQQVAALLFYLCCSVSVRPSCLNRPSEKKVKELMGSTGTKQEQLSGTQTLSALHGQTIELMFLKE